MEEGAANEDAEIIIDLGCPKKVHGLQIKNSNTDDGGTKSFTIYLSYNSNGPWSEILVSQLPKTESKCGEMKTFNLE